MNVKIGKRHSTYIRMSTVNYSNFKSCMRRQFKWLSIIPTDLVTVQLCESCDGQQDVAIGHVAVPVARVRSVACVYTCSYHTCSMYILNLNVCWSCSYSCSPIILFTKMLCECCVSRILQLKCDAYLTFEFYVVDIGADSNGRGMVWSAWKEWEFSDGKRRQDISLDPHALFLIFQVSAVYLCGTLPSFFEIHSY